MSSFQSCPGSGESKESPPPTIVTINVNIASTEKGVRPPFPGMKINKKSILSILFEHSMRAPGRARREILISYLPLISVPCGRKESRRGRESAEDTVSVQLPEQKERKRFPFSLQQLTLGRKIAVPDIAPQFSVSNLQIPNEGGSERERRARAQSVI